MSRKIWCFLGLLLLSAFEVSVAVDSDCNYEQILEPGKTYYVFNPNYPNSYAASTSCRWHAISDTRVRLTCEFEVASSENCMIDSVEVYTDPALKPIKYCGVKNVTVESMGKDMIITLTTATNTTGGRFICDMKAIKEEDCTCGQKKPTKIIGGIETGVNEYPMVAAIINVQTKNVMCGATIISNKYLLTAAHCFNRVRSVNDLVILVGDQDISTGEDTKATRLHRVAKVVNHPKYGKRDRTDYDIAVVTTIDTIAFSNEVGPVCLPFQSRSYSFELSKVDVLGWGVTEYQGPRSNTLRKVNVTVLPNMLCYEKIYVTNRQICTFDEEGKDACQYDSGGPVLWQNPTTRRLVLVGIISHGKTCADGYPGVNTRVGAFIEWVVQTTPGAQYCQNE